MRVVSSDRTPVLATEFRFLSFHVTGTTKMAGFRPWYVRVVSSDRTPVLDAESRFLSFHVTGTKKWLFFRPWHVRVVSSDRTPVLATESHFLSFHMTGATKWLFFEAVARESRNFGPDTRFSHRISFSQFSCVHSIRLSLF